MWKFKEDEKPNAPAPQSPAPVPGSAVPPRVGRLETPEGRAGVAHIGKSVVIKGELSGSEDLYLDGEVEGSIELPGHGLIVGPNGRVRANVRARDVVVHGKINGNVSGSERVELKKSAVLVGDITTQRIVIEDGAFFKGGIDIQREPAKPEPKSVAASAAVTTTATTAASSASAQGTLLETKK